jgi:hypothetical protein
VFKWLKGQNDITVIQRKIQDQKDTDWTRCEGHSRKREIRGLRCFDERGLEWKMKLLQLLLGSNACNEPLKKNRTLTLNNSRR